MTSKCGSCPSLSRFYNGSYGHTYISLISPNNSDLYISWSHLYITRHVSTYLLKLDIFVRIHMGGPFPTVEGRGEGVVFFKVCSTWVTMANIISGSHFVCFGLKTGPHGLCLWARTENSSLFQQVTTSFSFRSLPHLLVTIRLLSVKSKPLKEVF